MTSDVTQHASAALAATTDPMLRRLSEEWALPAGSLGEQLRAAAQAGDMAVVDRLASELADALTAGAVPADQEVASLAALVVHQRGDGPVGSAEAVYRRRGAQAEVRYLRACSMDRAYRTPEAAAELAALRTDCATDGDRFCEACCLVRLGRVQQFAGELDAARQSYAAALPLYRETRDRLGEANVHRSLGRLRLAEKQPREALELFGQGAQLSADVGDALGLMASQVYSAGAFMALSRPGQAALALEDALRHAGAAHNMHGRALALYRQAGALAASGQQQAALAALHLCRPVARQTRLDYGRAIDRAFQLFQEQSPVAYQALAAELETDAEAIRRRGVQVAAARVELERRLDAHRAEVQQLTDLVEIVRSAEPPADQLTALGPTLAGLLAREDISDLVGGFLNGVLLDLLRAGRHADVIRWVERLDEFSPPERRGVFAPLAVAARHQRGLAEDRHILDQQPPEVRQAVEMILQTIVDETASDASGAETPG